MATGTLRVSGDLDLIGTVRGWDRGPVALAVVTEGRVRVAGVGCDPSREVEIGSVSKGLTGLLYEDALDRGEVRRGMRLGEALPQLGDCPAATVTLDQLATHRSGMPRLPRGMSQLRRTLDLYRRGTNPYGDTLVELLAQTRITPLSRSRRPAYSNLGFELLGHAVAMRAGLTFRALVRERLSGPLGLGSMYVPAERGDLRATSMRGTSRRGRPREAWVGEGIAPAGGVRATVGDVGTLALALLEDAAPGANALRPREPFAGLQIGSAWLTSTVGRGATAREIVWHNGGTGGFRSFLGLDLEAGNAVVAVSPRSRGLDAPASRLLLDLAAG